MGTAMRTGHYILPDGGVLRVDFEMGPLGGPALRALPDDQDTNRR
jgi:hypothetical protein